MASRLDCCGRCEIEEDTKDTIFGRYVDAYTRCEGAAGLSTERGKELMVIRQYTLVPIKRKTRNNEVSNEC